MRKSKPFLTVAAAIVVLLGGCSKDEPAVRGLTGNEADSLNVERAKFEKSEDPPFNVSTLYAAGQLAESQSALPNAIEQYKAALKVDPKHSPSLFRLGVIYAKLKNYPEAIATWKQYVSATGNDASGYGNLGFCHELAGQRDEAEAAYKQGVAKDPKNVPCRVNYGLMLARIGRVDEAIAQLQTVLSPAQVHYNLGSVYEAQGKKEPAKNEYRKALELDPKLTDAATRLDQVK